LDSPLQRDYVSKLTVLNINFIKQPYGSQRNLPTLSDLLRAYPDWTPMILGTLCFNPMQRFTAGDALKLMNQSEKIESMLAAEVEGGHIKMCQKIEEVERLIEKEGSLIGIEEENQESGVV
jgi:hypothetical protein